MTSLVEELIRLSNKLVSDHIPEKKKYDTLKAIKQFDISIDDLRLSGLGKSVKKCSKMGGAIGILAEKMVNKWRVMVNEAKTKAEEQEKLNAHEAFKMENNEKYSNEKSKVDKSNLLKSKNHHTEIYDNRKLDNAKFSQNETADNECLKRQSILEDKNPESKRRKTENFQEKNYLEKDVINKSTKVSKPDQLDNGFSKEISKVYNNVPKHSERRKTDTFQKNCLEKDVMPKSSKVENGDHSDKYSKIHTKPKQKKPEDKDAAFFNTLFNDPTMLKRAEEFKAKRKSEATSDFIESKKTKFDSRKDISFIPNDLPELPKLNSSLSDDDVNAEAIYERMDLMCESKANDSNTEYQEDIDCTSKYTSQRKIWVPKSKFEVLDNSQEENIEKLNGVLVTDLAKYGPDELLAFEGDNRKLMRKTECYWEKLFNKIQKTANKYDDEKWRDAFLRAEREKERKLDEIKKRLNSKTKQQLQGETRAIVLTSVPSKSNRRFTDMRR